jgi:protein-disulfide isomerase
MSRRERRAAARAERVRPPSSLTRQSGRPSAWRSPTVLITVAGLVLGLGLVLAMVVGAPKGPSGGDSTLQPPPSYRPATLEDSRELGSPSAPVLLEVWSDYQCPVCGRFAREYMPRLVEDFVVPGTLRIVDQSIDILGSGDPSESLLAATAADCAGRQGRYWAYHDWLFWNQAGENRGAFNRDRLLAIAANLGLDMPVFETCLDSPADQAEVRSRTEAARAAGINSTPTFVVNGELIVGLVGYDELAARIRQVGGASPGSPAPSTPSPSGP